MAVLLQGEGDSNFFWVWIVFILLPLIGRVIGGVLSKLNPKAGEESDESAAPESRADGADRTQRREVAQELERRGEELWKELLGGGAPTREETPEEPPPMRPDPVARKKVETPRAAKPVRDELTVAREEAAPPHAELPSTLSASTQERRLVADRPRAELPALRGFESRAAGDSEREPLRGSEPLRALSGGAPTTGLRRALLELPGAGFDWRQAVVLSEIFGQPVAMRDTSLPGPPSSQP